ncbi:MAG TPA: RDD family protein [Mucilaginibacter sp.]|jgi:uncharacterized RDD family membrane protein YckC|nr:RDD family protein [Mucilaginibacter sp.]
MDDQYYILEDGGQTGPFTLQELIDAGPDIHTRVMSPRENAWRDACDLPELYDYFRGLGIYFPTEDNLASFWIRLGAFIIDIVLVSFLADIIIAILSARGLLPSLQALGNMQALNKMPPRQFILLQVVLYLTLIVYNTIGEASALEGSLGKRICGLIVVNADGEGISFANALGRSLGKVISLNFWGLGFISIFWSEHRQALHDYLAKTYVIKKNA